MSFLLFEWNVYNITFKHEPFIFYRLYASVKVFGKFYFWLHLMGKSIKNGNDKYGCYFDDKKRKDANIQRLQINYSKHFIFTTINCILFLSLKGGIFVLPNFVSQFQCYITKCYRDMARNTNCYFPFYISYLFYTIKIKGFECFWT